MAGSRHSNGGGDASSPESSLIAEYNFRTARLDEFEHVLKNTVTEHRLSPYSRGVTVDGEFGFNGWSDLSVFHVRFGCKLEAELAPEDSDDRIGFAMNTEGSGQLLLRGREYQNVGQMGVVFTSGPPRILRFSEDCHGSGVMMSRHRIAEYCSKLLGHEIDGQVEFETQFRLDDAAGQSWLRLVQYTTGELRDPMSLARRLPAARQQLEQMVVTGFLLAHSHNYSDELLRPQSPAVPYYVRRAEAYIEAHFSEPLSLAEIAAQAGVSARSLQNGFQNFRHTTPMAFLRQMRLQHAHRALLKADPAFATVTDIAVSCGFGHLGEFATLYKRTFGETPRQTLHRIR
ncbi:AraC family transcriptional regulator [Microvirga sp. GCM10011540]|uniref:helix-turn-helix transcriptional regulator n=1 Tax=Microvirga sp. GCM10011540 TaxID=3317338 RepID=UPI0036113106